MDVVMLPQAGQKQLQEEALERILEEYNIDFLVLARYMQIFSKEFCERHWRHTINIHHSFLPAFEMEMLVLGMEPVIMPAHHLGSDAGALLFLCPGSTPLSPSS
eukprot:351612-Chlamydomonas_euryale.AAC.15